MSTEFRFAEFRAEGDTVSGVVMSYGSEARFGAFTESFAPGSLAGDDVIVNLMHVREKPVARTGAGLALTDSPTELRASITLPDTVYGREARELVQARILRGFSVEFRATEDQWDGVRRTVRAAELVGIGLVDRPAYAASQIAVRMDKIRCGTLSEPGAKSAAPVFLSGIRLSDLV